MKERARVKVALALLSAATVFAGLCWAGLSRQGERRIADVLLVVDVTQSMNVKDVQWAGDALSRLQFAKRASQEMLLRWPCGSKLALAMFSGHRTFVMFKSVEVCAHHDELHAALGSLDWRSAWVARSEVSKGLFSAMKILPQVSDKARIVFVTDGHEAPPLHENYRPKLSDSIARPGGVVIGVGGHELVRIPKFGPNGESQGYWRSTEVLQVDTYRMGRSNGEALVGVDQSDIEQKKAAGREHLSSLKEDHLRSVSLLTEMHYGSASSMGEFEALLEEPVLWRSVDATKPLAPLFAVLSGVLLLLRLLLPLLFARSRS